MENIRCINCPECWNSGDNHHIIRCEEIQDVKIPVEPRTHYCRHENLEYARKLVKEGELSDDLLPDWCPRRKCRVCGCTWDHGCLEGCYWVEDDLCSKCAEKLRDKEGEKFMNEKIETTSTKPEETGLQETEDTADTAAPTSYERARRITNEIRANGYMAAEALVEMCKGIKTMRDERLYTELGYDAFPAYTMGEFHIAERQAYKYIEAYERLGGTFIKDHGELGITKLLLIADMPVTERDEVLENNDVSDMSARQVKELTEKLRGTGEQLSFITQERDKLQAVLEGTSEAADEENEKLRSSLSAAEQQTQEARRRADEFEKQLAERPTVSAPDTKALEQARKDAAKAERDKFKAELESKTKKAAQDARKEAESKVSAAREEGLKLGEERVRRSLEAVEKEKAEAIERARELEKKAAVASSEETPVIAYLFEKMQEMYNQLTGYIAKAENRDPAAAEKFRAALQKMLEMMSDKLVNK